jgi:hypothetical protein
MGNADSLYIVLSDDDNNFSFEYIPPDDYLLSENKDEDPFQAFNAVQFMGFEAVQATVNGESGSAQVSNNSRTQNHREGGRIDPIRITWKPPTNQNDYWGFDDKLENYYTDDKSYDINHTTYDNIDIVSLPRNGTTDVILEVHGSNLSQIKSINLSSGEHGITAERKQSENAKYTISITANNAPEGVFTKIAAEIEFESGRKIEGKIGAVAYAPKTRTVDMYYVTHDDLGTPLTRERDRPNVDKLRATINARLKPSVSDISNIRGFQMPPPPSNNNVSNYGSLNYFIAGPQGNLVWETIKGELLNSRDPKSIDDRPNLSNNISKLLIVNSIKNCFWLARPIETGDDEIAVYVERNTYPMLSGQFFYIGSNSSVPSPAEMIQIDADSDYDEETINTIRYAYMKYKLKSPVRRSYGTTNCICRESIGGFQIQEENFAVAIIRNYADIFVHEILHSLSFGGLLDVGANFHAGDDNKNRTKDINRDNVMYWTTQNPTPKVSPVGLRFRPIYTVHTGGANPRIDGSGRYIMEMQWDKVNGFSRR